MTVILTDVRCKLSEDDSSNSASGSCSEVLYADDTLLLGTSAAEAEKQLACIVEIGEEYGLEMNWGKVEVLAANAEVVVRKPDGTALKQKASMTYLGALIAADGRAESELARRIGLAEAEFLKLSQVWKNSGLSTYERCKVFSTCVVSMLLYGLQTMALGGASLKKIDGFQARCLRRILGTAPSYWSRVSNKTILGQARAPKLSILLVEQQLGFLGTIAHCPAECPVRGLVFDEHLCFREADFKRRRGRPRLEWAKLLQAHVRNMCPNDETLRQRVSDRAGWRGHVRKYCRTQHE